jgi:hypothetical protein
VLMEKIKQHRVFDSSGHSRQEKRKQVAASGR